MKDNKKEGVYEIRLILDKDGDVVNVIPIRSCIINNKLGRFKVYAVVYDINNGIIDDILVRSEIDSKDKVHFLSEDKQKRLEVENEKPKYYLCFMLNDVLYYYVGDETLFEEGILGAVPFMSFSLAADYKSQCDISRYLSVDWRIRVKDGNKDLLLSLDGDYKEELSDNSYTNTHRYK